MKSVLFDLDNTLYDVEQYFIGAFKEIAVYLSNKHNISEYEIFDTLMSIWKDNTSMHPSIFNDCLEKYGLMDELNFVLKLFNDWHGELLLYDDALETLESLKSRNYKIGLITDGNAERQKRRIKSLKIEDLFDVIILTNEIGHPKPSTIPYEKAISLLNIEPNKSYYVGDNPKIDFEGAKSIGLNTIRLLKGEFMIYPKNSYIDYEINDLNGIMEIVE